VCVYVFLQFCRVLLWDICLVVFCGCSNINIRCTWVRLKLYWNQLNSELVFVRFLDEGHPEIEYRSPLCVLLISKLIICNTARD